MQMTASAFASAALQANLLTNFHLVALAYQNALHMRISGLQTVAVADNHFIAVSAVITGGNHRDRKSVV